MQINLKLNVIKLFVKFLTFMSCDNVIKMNGEQNKKIVINRHEFRQPPLQIAGSEECGPETRSKTRPIERDIYGRYYQTSRVLQAYSTGNVPN